MVRVGVSVGLLVYGGCGSKRAIATSLLMKFHHRDPKI